MSKLYLMESALVFCKTVLFPATFASEMAGSNRTESELVSVDGNNINGNTMPFKMPNKRSASASDKPLIFKRYGTKTDSKLCNILIINRFADNGKARENKCFVIGVFELC